ncbi:hypothetical protein LDENG_00117870 [Lucifuga dentata]|nr:hypothetical protein LDENG_00117870 [Lucifuga dentata]
MLDQDKEKDGTERSRTSTGQPPSHGTASYTNAVQTLLKPLTMSQTAKSASSQGSDAKDKGAPAPAASSKATKTGEPGMGSYRIMLFDQENFQGRMMEVQNECMNVCDRGMDRFCCL